VPSPSAPSLNHQAVLLAFEASTSRLSVAVMRGPNDMTLVERDAKVGQAADLIPMAVRAMADAGLGFDSITHVAAGRGPGSFTGIRVALASAKGVCLAQGIPGLGVSGLEALAFAGRKIAAGRHLLCLADTRRGSLYAQLFDGDAGCVGDVFEASPDQLALHMPASLKTHPMVILGHGAADLALVFQRHGWPAVNPAPATAKALSDGVDAGMIARLALHRLDAGLTSPLQPLYLADPRLGPKKTSR